MHFHVLTLFPEMFESFERASVLGRAVSAGLVQFHHVQIRDFADNKHRSTDDTPSGGGSGMVMSAPPLVAAIESVRAASAATPSEPASPTTTPDTARVRRILLTPQGQPFTQRVAERLALLPEIMLVCGRYEGFDERVRAYVDEEISVGDYILTGGEVAAMVVMDAVARLLPGVLGNADSSRSESHGEDIVLEYPQYTRPQSFRGVDVPAVLSSGDHARVARWRRWQALRRTRERRPDLFARIALSEKERAALDGDEP